LVLKAAAELELRRRKQTGRSYSLRRKIDPAHPVTPIRRTFYRKQYDFVMAGEHFVALIGGIGSGKSLAGAARALRAAYGHIGANTVRTPNLGLVTAPTYRMLEDTTLRTFLEVAEGRVVDFIKSEMVAVLENGSEVLFRSVEEPQRLRGVNVTWWFADEAALYDPIVWQIGIGRLRQFGQSGYAWLTTTPKGRNWVYKTFVQEQLFDHRLIRTKTEDNPYLDRGFVESLRQSYAGDFARQELDAEFVAFEGLVYPEYDARVHRYVTPVERGRLVRIAAGVDWGYTNPGVIVVGGLDGDGRLYVLHEEYARQRLIDDWVRVAQQLTDVYRIDTFYCDPAEPTNISRFLDAGLPAVKADNAVTDGIQAVKARLVTRADGLPRLLVHAGCANLLAEFEQYQWMTSRDGVMRDQPLKANDHAMDALRYLVAGVSEPQSVVTLGSNKVL
jgi:PBSX family phage terminase large subunit